MLRRFLAANVRVSQQRSPNRRFDLFLLWKKVTPPASPNRGEGRWFQPLGWSSFIVRSAMQVQVTELVPH